MPQPGKWITIKAARQRLGIGQNRMYSLVYDGYILAKFEVDRWYVLRAHIECIKLGVMKL